MHCRNRLAGFNAVDVEGRSLIVSGMLAESLLLAAIAVNLVIAWLIVLAGMLHLIIAHPAHWTGSLIWRLMISTATNSAAAD